MTLSEAAIGVLYNADLMNLIFSKTSNRKDYRLVNRTARLAVKVRVDLDKCLGLMTKERLQDFIARDAGELIVGENLRRALADIIVPSGSLPGVTKLSITKHNCSKDDLKSFLQKIPNLQDLLLQGYNQGNDFYGFRNIAELSNLKKLMISGSNIGIIHFSQILTKSPNLQSLFVARANEFDIPSDAILRISNLPKLTELAFTQSDISSLQLGQILAKTQNVEKLALKYCSNLKKADDLNDLPELKNLKLLIIEKSSIDLTQLGKVLSKSPNIEKIDLIDCKHLGNSPLKIDLDCLPQLKNLNLKGSKEFSEKDFKKHFQELFKKSPNLEIFYVNHQIDSSLDADLIQDWRGENPSALVSSQRAEMAAGTLSGLSI